MIRAAAVQAEAGADIAGLVREAASGGANVVAFPETFVPGYPAWLDVCRDAGLWDHPPVKALYRRMAEQSVVVPGPFTQQLGALAREYACVIVIGVVERVDAGPGRGTLYNTLLTFGPDGSLLHRHRKLMPTYTERLVWGQSDVCDLDSVPTPHGRIGGLICWEHWMPLARQAMHEASEDIHVAAWPMVKDMNHLACRHYAFEGRCFVIATGALLRAEDLPRELEPVLTEGWVLRGGSAIYGPAGDLLAGPVYDQPTILYADLDLGRVREESMNLDVTGHYARPDLLRLERIDKPGATGP